MADKTIRMTAPPDVYRRRRARLANSLKRPLVLFSGHAPARNYAGKPAYEFRAGSSYLYFGGPPLENGPPCCSNPTATASMAAHSCAHRVSPMTPCGSARRQAMTKPSRRRSGLPASQVLDPDRLDPLLASRSGGRHHSALPWRRIACEPLGSGLEPAQ